MSKENLVPKLTPIHPFTRRQGEIIELTARGLSYKEIGIKLNISRETIKNLVSGKVSSEDVEMTDVKSELGIFGIIQRYTGVRPMIHNWTATLFGDVLFLVLNEPNN